MLSLLRLITTFLALLSLSFAQSSTGSSILVILEPQLKREDFSLFFGGLEKRGYQITFREPKDVTPQIIAYDIPQFSHVILFTPTTKSFAPDITPQSLVSLLSTSPPTNLLIVLSTTQTPLSILAAEFSLSLPPPQTPLISHFPERPPPHTVLPIKVPASHPFLTPNLPPIIFSGVPHALGNNPLLVPILRAPPESFATDTEKDSDADVLCDAGDKGGEGLWAGSQLGVVTGFQTRSGGRVTWVGGIDVFTNEYSQKEVSPGVKSGNLRFCQDIAAWTFQESLVHRIDSVYHYRVRDNSTRDMYTVNDHLVFGAHISSFDPSTKTWIPNGDIKDLQLEFTMLDPHIRTALPHIAHGRYQTQFRAPDRHGVYKFAVDWRHKGQTWLHSSTTVSIVPPRHDEYPRFLSAAWPYYAGALSTSIGFLAFSVLWLSGEVAEKKNKLRGKVE